MQFNFEPLAHTEALTRIQSLPTVSREVFDGLVPELRAAVFTVKGVAAAKDREAIRDLIAAVPAGGDTFDSARKKVVAVLRANNFNDKAAARRAQLLLLHWTGIGYSAARYRLAVSQIEFFPYWQYLSMGDSKVRATHAALNGKIFPAPGTGMKGEEFWQDHLPPWEPMCRCSWRQLTEFDVEEIRKEDESLPVEQRRIIEGPMLDRVLKGELIASTKLTEYKNGVAVKERWTPIQPFSLTPRQGWSGWNPDNIVPSEADLKKQLQPQSFNELMTWAETVKVDAGDTVAAWIKGIPQAKRLRRVKPWSPPKPRAKKPAPAPPVEAAPAIPDIEQLTAGKRLGGSTGAVEYTAADGAKFVVKKGASAEHLREEFATDEIYRAAGVPVPAAKLQETSGRPVKIAVKIEGKQLGEWNKTATPAQQAEMQRKLREGFAVDALVGNWDVIGMSQDNIIVDKAGVPWRIDNGGGLRFRAMGGLKTAAEWQAHPDELWTMRESVQGQPVFGGMGIQQIAAAISKLDEPKILAAAPPAARDMVAARLRTLKDVAIKAQDMAGDFKDEYTDRLTREMVLLRRAGITGEGGRLPRELRQSPGDTTFVDENGRVGDNLRTGGTVQGQAAGDFPTILDAVKTVNGHLAKGDTAFNQSKMTAALKLLPTVQKKAAAGDAEATHYLPFLTAVKAAADGQPAKIANLTPWTAPGKKAAPTQSTVADLAAHIAARGGSYSHVSAWQGSQAGSSWSSDSLAYKALLAEKMQPSAVKDAYWKASLAKAQAELAEKRRMHGDRWELSLTIHHAFVQELLGQVDFRHNDRSARLTRIIRTDYRPALAKAGLTPGQSGVLKRGLNESGSIFAPVWLGSEGTVQAVPHHRVTGVYFMERHPGNGGGAFLGDGENEFTFIAHGLKSHYTGTHTVSADAGSDSTKWEIQP